MKKFSLLIFFVAIGCAYKIPKNEKGERVLGKNVNYKLTEIPNNESLVIIDTTAFYVQVFEGRYYNDSEMKYKQVFKFHKNGQFYWTIINSKNEIPKTFSKKSINYGGRYRMNGNNIELERFLPNSGGATNYFIRQIQKARIENGKLIDHNGLITVCEKKNTLSY